MKASGIRNVPFLNLDHYSIRNILQLTDERKKRVIDLYFNQHKTYAEIAEIIIAVSLGSKTNKPVGDIQTCITY
jgi:DNA-directed RNA polymerase specialized sigma subunit